MLYKELKEIENIEQEEYIKQWIQKNNLKKNKRKNKIKKIKEFLVINERVK